MTAQRHNVPLSKTTVRLYEGDALRLRELHPLIKLNTIIREIVRRHIRSYQSNPRASHLELSGDDGVL